MSNPLIHACDEYIILEPGEEEKILSARETLLWLQNWLQKVNHLPIDLQNQGSLSLAAERLLDTACELEIKNGFRIQWFAIRLNPPES